MVPAGRRPRRTIRRRTVVEDCPVMSSRLRGRRALLALSAAAFMAAPLAIAEAQQWQPPNMRSSAPSLNPVPRPRNERAPAARAGYVWVPGHWAWNATQGRHWSDGHWERDRPGWRFEGPRWVMRRGEWVFIPGRWVR